MTDQINLLEEFTKTLKQLGPEQLIYELKQAREKKIGNTKVFFVFESVCESMGMCVADFDKNERDYNRKVAIGLCAHFLIKEMAQTANSVAQSLPFFRLQKRAINKYSKLITDAKLVNPKSEIDKLISKHYHIVIEKINNYKTNKDGSQ